MKNDELVLDREKWDKLSEDEKFKLANIEARDANHFESSLMKVLSRKESLKFADIRILQMFLWNRGNFDLFYDAMKSRYGDDKTYIENLWPQFRDNPIGFLVSRNETDVFDFFMNIIKETDYRG